MSKPKTIRLGICMAGAVSAGAYTAGVIDYLIETLERWEQRKAAIRKKIENSERLSAEDELIPMHDVVIEVLSGASAGGMTAAVLAYSFNDGAFVTRRNGGLIEENYNLPAHNDTPTKLYEAWINMADDEKGDTFSRLMDASDVTSIEKMGSLLNTKPIDDIAAKAVPAAIRFEPPPYISRHLNVLLSVTNMEGVPVNIRFSNIDGTNPTRNVLKMHSGFLHYQFHPQAVETDFPPEIIGEHNKKHLADAAKATGAFPFGLANRRMIIDGLFFNGFKQNLKKNYNIDVDVNLAPEQDYIFTAVDGGAINNEPIGTTFRLLESKKKNFHPSEDHFVILIDPFPTITNTQQEMPYSEPDPYNLFQQAKKLLGVFRNQSAFKQEDLLNGLEMDQQRFLIYPAKRRMYFLASGLLGGFSGFLKKAFRSHDYQLGRKNCQTFLRYYFGRPIDDFEKITGLPLTAPQREYWCYDAHYGRTNAGKKMCMPFVPDVLVLNKNSGEIATPEYEGLTVQETEQVNARIKERLEAIVNSSYGFLIKQGRKVNRAVPLVMKLLSGWVKRKIVHMAASNISAYLDKKFAPQSVAQDVLTGRYAVIIEAHGKLYKKVRGVFAVVAQDSETVVSVTAGGVETTNTALKGDMIVTNDTPAQERYVVKAEKFNQRYQLVHDNYYMPLDKAQVLALPLTLENIYRYGLHELEMLVTDPGRPVYVQPAWKESQVLRPGDYLVCPPDKSEVYRIAKAEFEHTYREINGA